MTEYELIATFVSFQSLLQTWITTYFSVTTAYLITAYVVGARLSRSQAVIVSGCFVLFAGLCIYASFGTEMRMLELIGEIRALNPARRFAFSPIMALVTLLISSVGIVVSLKFMWDVRHPGQRERQEIAEGVEKGLRPL